MINSFEQPYNWYNLEPNYRMYLSAVKNIKPVSIKNYLSDIRYFVGWASSLHATSPSTDLNLIMHAHTLTSYRDFLIASKLPRRTINRRLSSVRSLCDFLISQNIIEINPSKELRNFSDNPATQPNLELVQNFLSDQTSESSQNSQGLNELKNDIEEFLAVSHVVGI